MTIVYNHNISENENKFWSETKHKLAAEKDMNVFKTWESTLRFQFIILVNFLINIVQKLKRCLKVNQMIYGKDC